jgi:hypothetical protein
MTTDVIRTIVEFSTVGDDKVREQLKFTRDAAGNLLKQEITYQTKKKDGWKTTKKISDDLLKSRNDQIKSTARLRNVMLGMGLSTMFLGMAIQRTSSNILKALINTYAEATDKNSKFNVGINRLTGAFEYLKFTIIDAFMESGAFEFVIESLISIIEWFDGLDDTTKSFIVSLSLIGVVLGGVMVVVGQLATAWSSVFGVGAIGAGTASLSGILSVLGWIGVAIIAIYFLWKNNIGKIQDAVSAIFGSDGTLWKVFGGFFEFIGGLFSGDFNKVVHGFLTLLFSLAATIYNIFAFVVNGVRDLLVNLATTVAKSVITVINTMINAWNWAATKMGLTSMIIRYDKGAAFAAMDEAAAAMKSASLPYITGSQIETGVNGVSGAMGIPTPSSSGGTQIINNNQVTVNATQRAGESNSDFARRVADEISRSQRQSAGSPGTLSNN